MTHKTAGATTSSPHKSSCPHGLDAGNSVVYYVLSNEQPACVVSKVFASELEHTGIIHMQVLSTDLQTIIILSKQLQLKTALMTKENKTKGTESFTNAFLSMNTCQSWMILATG